MRFVHGSYGSIYFLGYDFSLTISDLVSTAAVTTLQEQYTDRDLNSTTALRSSKTLPFIALVLFAKISFIIGT
ncbi:hypothetical protein GGR58DRAFT_490576 [Xylaria digitata]|nr:hypothetical protein GGR58DRAFT_490576 [Xylaria digitata]